MNPMTSSAQGPLYINRSKKITQVHNDLAYFACRQHLRPYHYCTGWWWWNYTDQAWSHHHSNLHCQDDRECPQEEQEHCTEMIECNELSPYWLHTTYALGSTEFRAPLNPSCLQTTWAFFSLQGEVAESRHTAPQWPLWQYSTRPRLSILTDPSCWHCWRPSGVWSYTSSYTHLIQTTAKTVFWFSMHLLYI